MSNKKVNIEYILEIERKRQEFNRMDLGKVNFFKDGKKVNISQEIIDEYKFTGLNNMDFITTGFYDTGLIKE